MKKTQLPWKGFRVARVGAVALLLALSSVAQAQEACLLQPVLLAERVAAAPLVVEARVSTVRSLDTGPHLITLNELEVFKVFAGTLPAGPLTLVTVGGTVGLRREVVSNEPGLAPDDQGIFLLEPHPGRPGTYRLVTGPQGLIRYHLPTATAADAFARYTSIPEQVYPVLELLLGHPAQALRPNQALQQRLQRVARPAATPVVSGFSPATVTAGTNTVLTITGSGFGATQGNGSVQFSNADNGGSSFVAPLASDYVSWSDTQIQVRVPSTTVGNSGPAGTGRLLITNATSETTLSPSELTVNYALTTVLSSNQVYRAALVGKNGTGGYTLTYNDAFAANTAAVGSFERALTTWRNGVGANRVRATGTTTVNTAVANDNLNIVAFDDAAALPGGTLGVTYQYYAGCGNAQGGLDWLLDGTDYIFKGNARFTNGFSWQYSTAAPTTSQYDFESVVLHELGHGILQGHIIKPGAVMHYAISNGSQNRVLNSTNDVAGGNAIIDYSLTAGRCGNPTYVRLAPVPLPVTLVSFGVERVAAGVRLRWQTAAEVNSAFFAVETTLDPAGEWQELTRQPAAGNSTTTRRYEYLDERAGAGVRYYRLRQQDEDGTVSYSAVAAVTVTSPGQLATYPNPFTTALQVALPAAEAATLRLYTLTGQLLLTQAIASGQTVVELSVPGVRPGVYVLEWRPVGGPSVRTRVVKQ